MTLENEILKVRKKIQEESAAHVRAYIKKYMKQAYVIINEIMKQSDVRYIIQVAQMLQKTHEKIFSNSQKTPPEFTFVRKNFETIFKTKIQIINTKKQIYPVQFFKNEKIIQSHLEEFRSQKVQGEEDKVNQIIEKITNREIKLPDPINACSSQIYYENWPITHSGQHRGSLMYIDGNNPRQILQKISACCKEKVDGTILLFRPQRKNSLIVPSQPSQVNQKYLSLEEQDWFRDETKKIANLSICYYSRTEIKIDFIPVQSDPLKRKRNKEPLYTIPRIVVYPGELKSTYDLRLQSSKIIPFNYFCTRVNWNLETHQLKKGQQIYKAFQKFHQKWISSQCQHSCKLKYPEPFHNRIGRQSQKKKFTEKQFFKKYSTIARSFEPEKYITSCNLSSKLEAQQILNFLDYLGKEYQACIIQKDQNKAILVLAHSFQQKPSQTVQLLTEYLEPDFSKKIQNIENVLKISRKSGRPQEEQLTPWKLFYKKKQIYQSSTLKKFINKIHNQYYFKGEKEDILLMRLLMQLRFMDSQIQWTMIPGSQRNWLSSVEVWEIQ